MLASSENSTGSSIEEGTNGQRSAERVGEEVADRKTTATCPISTRQAGLAARRLEGRVLLAATAFTVNAITDTGAGSGTTGDLLYCITQANDNPNTDGSVIQFDPTLFGSPQSIAPAARWRFPNGRPGDDRRTWRMNLVMVSGNNAVQVFAIGDGVVANISGLAISYGYGSGVFGEQKYIRRRHQQPGHVGFYQFHLRLQLGRLHI